MGGGTSKIVKLSIRWLDSTERDLQTLGIDAWNKTGLNTNQWRGTGEKVMPAPGYRIESYA